VGRVVFTVDWFSAHIPIWEEKVLPKLRSIKRPTYLEIGSHEGRSLLWMLNNVPDLTATSIDPHQDGSWENFNSNIGNDHRIEVFRESSGTVLPKLIWPFNVIYIDGSHYAYDVLLDSVLSWRLLKSGGLMIWDDYAWILEDEEWKRPKPAIDAFLICYRTQYRVLHIGYQVIVEKI
jgi:predicted O-methyltransferase YrrM